MKPAKELLVLLDIATEREQSAILRDVETTQLKAKAVSLRWGALSLMKLIVSCKPEASAKHKSVLKGLWDEHYTEQVGEYLPSVFKSDVEFHIGIEDIKSGKPLPRPLGEGDRARTVETSGEGTGSGEGDRTVAVETGEEGTGRGRGKGRGKRSAADDDEDEEPKPQKKQGKKKKARGE